MIKDKSNKVKQYLLNMQFNSLVASRFIALEIHVRHYAISEETALSQS